MFLLYSLVAPWGKKLDFKLCPPPAPLGEGELAPPGAAAPRARGRSLALKYFARAVAAKIPSEPTPTALNNKHSRRTRPLSPITATQTPSRPVAVSYHLAKAQRRTGEGQRCGRAAGLRE